MRRNMWPYYLSRLAISMALGLLLFVTGSPLWHAIMLGGLILALFLWAPHSGRYAVHPEFGVAALRRDERTQAINDRAAKNAFVISMLATAGIALYASLTGAFVVSLGVLKALLIIGALVYFASDLWLRRSAQ